MQIKVKVTGLREVQSGLQKIDAGLTDTSDLVYNAGLLVERQTKQNWGRGTHEGGYPNVQTGNLRASVVTTLSSPVRAIVGTNVRYASAVEFGHRTRGHLAASGFRGLKSRISAVGMGMTRAYPFFFPAIEQTKDKITALVKKWVSNLLEK